MTLTAVQQGIYVADGDNIHLYQSILNQLSSVNFAIAASFPQVYPISVGESVT